MTLTVTPDLDQSARTRGGLLAVAPRITEPGWQNGIQVRWMGCNPPVITDLCAIADKETTPSDVSAFYAINVLQSAGCSTLGISTSTSTAIARDRLEATTEYALGQLLLTGSGTANANLQDATDANASANAVDAVSCLESAVARTGFGGRAFLHAAPRAAAYLRQYHLIDDLGLSPSGHQWIISPGYELATPGTATILYATGAVWAAADPVFTLPTNDWRANNAIAYAERMAIVAFDPCLLVASSFTVPACT